MLRANVAVALSVGAILAEVCLGDIGLRRIAPRTCVLIVGLSM
jgi:hypothetical protein